MNSQSVNSSISSSGVETITVNIKGNSLKKLSANSKPVVAAPPAGLEVALLTFVNEARKMVTTFLTLMRSSNIAPADMIAFVTLTEVLCCLLYCCSTHCFDSRTDTILVGQRDWICGCLWRRARDDDLCTTNEPSLVPLWTRTSPPLKATDITELSPATTDTIISKISR